MNDPSSGVPPHLLRHIHLVCNQSFPVMPRPHLETIFHYLQEAPRLVRDKASMTWMALLEPPRDATVMLVWQPRNMVSFPSDGYVWLDGERSRSTQTGQYTMEVYAHQSGYRHGMENVTIHARRRYRLVPPQEHLPNALPADPCLWLIHYFQTEPANQIPVANMPMPDHARQILAERNALYTRGQLQLQHNEFMLHDRNKWPSINLPGTPASAYAQHTMVYPNNVMAQMSRNGHPSHMHHPQPAIPQRSLGQNPAKRVRHTSMSHGAVSGTAISAHLAARDSLNVEDETSTSVDYMDVMTPREISVLRYELHHEWLEEVLNSPYDTHTIIPGELGLGRKGELESLTKNFFSAHTAQHVGEELDQPLTPNQKDYEEGLAMVLNDPSPRVGRMAEGKATDFRKRAAARIDQVHADMEAMRVQHAKRMAQVKTHQIWKEANQDLRTVTLSLINGHSLEAETAAMKNRVQDIERRVGKQVKPLKDVECIEKGGLEDRAPATGDQNNLESIESVAFEDGGQLSESAESTSPSADLAAEPVTEGGDPEGPQPAAPAQPAPDWDGRPVESTQDHSVDDWIMVDKDDQADGRGLEQAAFDSFTNQNATMNLGEKDETVDAPENEDAAGYALTFGGNEFDAGLDFTDFNATGPELGNYAHDTEGVSNQQAASLGGDPGGDNNQTPGTLGNLGDAS